MIKKQVALLFFIAGVIGMSAASAAAQNFSADVTGKNPEGRFRGKRYMQNGNVRMEMPQAITITRVDKKVVWMLMPSQQMYMEHPLTARDYAVSNASAKLGEIERKPLGTDTLGGKTMNKFQVTYSGEGASLFEVPGGYQKFAMPSMADVLSGNN